MVGRPLRTGPAAPKGQKRVIAPDDDPTFLRDLSKKLRKEEDDEKPKDDDQK
jgi:hypothetical protein